MELIVASAGSYPRVGDTPELQQHRRAYARRERGELSEEAWRRVEDEVAAEVIREQIAAGAEVVTDGQVRWYDPFSHLGRAVEGVEIDGLLRFFDTNFYFRQPVVKGRLRRPRPILLGEFEFARSVSQVPVKPVVTGPYTLARGSVLSGGYRTVGELALAWAEVLAQEVAELAGAGAALIQVDEPAVLRHPEDLDVVEAALGRLDAARGAARLWLHLSFGDAAPHYPDLFRLPAQVLGLDFTRSPKLASVIREAGAATPLALGVVDALNTRLEGERDVFAIFDAVLPALPAGPTYVSPSWGLELLPRAAARAKLETLRRLRDAYRGGRR
jgi:5-methyltetrahydropteroyltriglutamate--homocysteine methyltransferase